MRITRLQLMNWRNFKAVDIELSDRAFIIGPNASGKSNLLDAIRFLRDLVAVGGGLQAAIAKRGGLTGLRALSATSNTMIGLAVDLGDTDTPREWTYQLKFSSMSKGGPPRVLSEVAFDHSKKKIALQRTRSSEKSDTETLSQTALEQSNSNRDFRAIAEFFRSIEYLHLVPEIVRDPSRAHGDGDVYGGDLIKRMNETPPLKRKRRLKLLESALQMAVPRLSNLEVWSDSKGVPHLRAKYKHWRDKGAWQLETQFSDGTLRMIGLIWSLQESDRGPMLFEEPELSLNPGVIGNLAPLMSRASRGGGRQFIVSTHSTELLSNGVDLSEVHLLTPGEHGTEVVGAETLEQVKTLVESGMPVGDAIMPSARATGSELLSTLDLAS